MPTVREGLEMKDGTMSRKRTKRHRVKKTINVGNLKMPRSRFVVLNVESVENLKEWATLSYVLVLVGGIVLGGVFLFFQPEIHIAIPSSCAVFGGALVLSGLLIEWRKFGSFLRGIKRGLTIGTLEYESKSLETGVQARLTDDRVFKSRNAIFVATEEQE